VEKFWKAGYTGIVHEKIRGVFKDRQYAVRWQKDRLQTAVKFPFRFLQTVPPEKWDISRVKKTEEAWELVQEGRIREGELAALVDMPSAVENVRAAIGHASVRKIVAYVTAQVEQEKEGRKTDYGYLQSPQIYRDYLRDCTKLELDLDDHSVLFPKDLKAAHQRTIAMVKYKASELQQKAFADVVKTLHRLEWEKDGLLMVLPKKTQELIDEGAALSHCVGGYIEQMVEKKTVILFVRQRTDPAKPFYTLEWRDGRVFQCRTNHNKTYTQDERVKAFVDAWVKHVTKKMTKKKKESAA
jgi:hypothetical protein